MHTPCVGAAIFIDRRIKDVNRGEFGFDRFGFFVETENQTKVYVRFMLILVYKVCSKF